jgi:hypothetical protein
MFHLSRYEYTDDYSGLNGFSAKFKNEFVLTDNLESYYYSMADKETDASIITFTFKNKLTAFKR